MYKELDVEFHAPETDPQWLEDRRNSIGASEVGAVLGVSKYSSPWHVYMSKRGNLPAFDGNEITTWGHIHELTIMKEVERRTGYEVREYQETIPHDDFQFLTCTPDAMLYDLDGKVPMEIKTASAYLQKQWEEDGIPLDYQAQCNAQICIMGVDHMYLAVLFGGNHLKIYRIERDEDLIEMVIDKCVSFWKNHIEPEVAPEVSGLDSDADILAELYAEQTDDTVEVEENLVDDIKKAEKNVAEWKSIIEEKKNKIKEKMGNAATASAGKYVVSWKKTNPRLTIDTMALKTELPEVYRKYARVGKSSRRFTIKGEKV